MPHRCGTVCHAGHAARGVVFGLAGGFVLVAAARVNAGEARGLDSTLATVAAQPFGPFLLGAVAVGLLLYGVYLFAEARYRRLVID